MDTPDFERILEAVPDCYLVLGSDAPQFTIVAVSDAYLAATHTTRELVLNKELFAVFPDNPDDATADGVSNLRASLMRVLEHKKIDYMPIQKYDIPRSRTEDLGFEERYWIPDNSPVLDDNGEVRYIVHHVSDATEPEQLIRKYAPVTHESEDPEAQKLTQTERLNRIMIERELRMAELKKELSACRAGLHNKSI